MGIQMRKLGEMRILSTISADSKRQFRRLSHSLNSKFKSPVRLGFKIVMRKEDKVVYDILVDKYSYHQIKNELDTSIREFVDKTETLSFA